MNITMRALRFHEYGPVEVLRFDDDVTVPEPGSGQVLIKVSGAGINPVDWKIRSGALDGLWPVTFPKTIGSDVSGTVVTLGPDVTDLEVGQDVFGTALSGSAADYALCDVVRLSPAPPLMDLADAAAVPIAAVTAYQALVDLAQVKPGQRVLIHAAAGGVGSFAVQIAKWLGATVIGTASAKNEHFVRELGADEFVDYRSESFEEVVVGVDVVLETIGGEEHMRRSIQAVKAGGIVVSVTSDELAEVAAASGKRSVHLFADVRRDVLLTLVGLINDLKIRPVVDTVVPFEEAIEAYRESEQGHNVGKVVIAVER